MFCKKCGVSIDEDSRFCSICGASQEDLKQNQKSERNEKTSLELSPSDEKKVEKTNECFDGELMSSENKGTGLINKVIWKVLFIVGGIAGSIFSISNLPEAFDDVKYESHRLQFAIEHDYTRSGIRMLETAVSEAQSSLWKWIVLFAVSVIIFIVGCVIKTKSTEKK